MRKLSLILAATTALIAGIGSSSQAAVVVSPKALLDAAGALDPLENVQIVYWDGRRYCWYDDGWQGPGWYWCGYRWRTGLGWGGGYGWQGWRGGHRGGHREIRRYEGPRQSEGF